ncbi:MAG: hypothetical protein MJ097_07060, partial [Dorea sp.]|nr:hypothetical protein [Dorea sp.]
KEIEAAMKDEEEIKLFNFDLDEPFDEKADDGELDFDVDIFAEDADGIYDLEEEEEFVGETLDLLGKNFDIDPIDFEPTIDLKK